MDEYERVCPSGCARSQKGDNNEKFDLSPEQLELYDEQLQLVEELRPITLQIGKLVKTVNIVAP